MKKNILLISAVFGLEILNACKDSGNKNIIVKEEINTTVSTENGKTNSATTSTRTEMLDGKKYEIEEFTYKATDGTPAKVMFSKTDGHEFLTIESGKSRLQLNKNADKKDTYELGDATAVVKGDSLIIAQKDNVIELVKTK